MEETKVTEEEVVEDKKDKPVKEKKSKGAKGSKKGFLGFIKKHWFLTILIIGIIVSVIIQINKKKQADAEANMVVEETAMLEKTDVTTTVSGTGKIVAGESKEIIVDDMATYKISKMNVKVGDQVKAGDVLCTFDTEELSLDLADAEAELNAINIKSNNSVATTKRNTTDTEIDKVTQTYRDIDDVDQLQRELDTKKGELAEAQRLYDKEYEIFSNIYNEDRYYSLLEKKAKDGVLKDGDLEDYTRQSTALTNLETLKTNITTAQTAVNTAQDKLTTAQENYTDNVRHGITSIENAHDNLEDAYASNSTARLNTQKTIRGYEAKLGETDVIAPIDGYITSIAVEEGNKYTGGALFKIENSSAYKVEVNIEEYDISDVAVGQKVIIRTNATGDEELEGKVSEVSPKAVTVATGSSSTSSTPSYKVTIELLTPNDRLRLDMTAKILITTNERDNVFAVPAEAIKEDEEGRTYINVGATEAANAADVLDSADGSTSFLSKAKYNKNKQSESAPKEKVYVTVGLESNYYTEISGDGLEEGMVVYLADDSDATGTDTNSSVLGGI